LDSIKKLRIPPIITDKSLKPQSYYYSHVSCLSIGKSSYSRRKVDGASSNKRCSIGAIRQCAYLEIANKPLREGWVRKPKVLQEEKKIKVLEV